MPSSSPSLRNSLNISWSLDISHESTRAPSSLSTSATWDDQIDQAGCQYLKLELLFDFTHFSQPPNKRFVLKEPGDVQPLQT